MIVMGIDPGSRNLGYSIVSFSGSKLSLIEAGVVKIKPQEFQMQILEATAGLEEIFARNSVDEVAIEDIFFAHNPKTVLKLAQFRGAIALKVLEKIGYFYEYTPLQVKKALTGNGKTTKEQVNFMVKRILGIKGEIKPLDVSDAMAVAITHTQRLKVKR
jgi:crossover junction endodeoxyribonuclease RuvC